ncbi:unnamed protein product [Paramecium primaurelia]|uniref:Palmitoyltransferase n=1 Tax=Paramecium primaurelia TaxID=5886 RepID=A0A8S1NAY4_PARPR|nr:unnamed protein product [Paramecium primaurelia]
MEESPATAEPLIQLTLGNNVEPENKTIYNFMDITKVHSGSDLIEAAKKNKMPILNASVDTVPNIYDLEDSEKRTVLHYLALNSNSFIFNRLLIKFQSQAKEWLQKQDKYDLQAIHYFIYSGKIDMLDEISRYYIPKNLLGMAAIKNDVLTMILIREKLKEETFKNKYQDAVTPLHLACSTKSDYAAIVLMKWKHPINIQDANGNTPLHIAALNNSYKLIRKLIQRGGSINIRNKKDQLPIDLAEDYQTLDALKSFRFSWKSLLLQLNLKPRKRSYMQSLIFLLFFSITNFGTIFLVQNSTNKDQNTGSFIMFIIIVTLFFICFLLVSYSNPGYANTKDEQNLKSLLNKLEPFEICYDCFIQTPDRSKHCEFCKRCVIKYDHHCPWVNNCVGNDNQSIFWLFLLFLFLDFLLIIILGILALTDQNTMENNNFTILIILTIIEFLFMIPLLNLILTQIRNYYSGLTTYERLVLGKPSTKKRESIIQKMSIVQQG